MTPTDPPKNDTRDTEELDDLPLAGDELDLLAGLIHLEQARVVEAGCGSARLLRQLVRRHPLAAGVGLEVDAVQHAKNLVASEARLRFVDAGAQSIPFPDASFDVALMLKSLHHVPVPIMDVALVELARVVRPGGWLYVSEPIYGGALNEIVRLYNDEGVVRREAQAALDRAVEEGRLWQAASEHRVAPAVHARGFADFAQRMLYPSFADHRITEDLLQRVREAYQPHQRAAGARFVRPMHVRLLRRTG